MRNRVLKALACLSLLFATSAPAEELVFQANHTIIKPMQAVVDAWTAKSGHTVKFLTNPNVSSDALALYQQQLASGSSDVDIYQIDTIWPGLIGMHLLDLSEDLGDRVGIYAESAINNNTVGGRLVGIPLYLECGLLYYRKDLLEKYNEPLPETWDDLIATAKKIMKAEREAGNPKMWGYVFQGKAYEGLTCNALEWISAKGGGSIVERDGTVSINNPRAVEALREAASWIGDISPDGVLGYVEEDTRGVFQSGDAVFLRNWSYCWGLFNQPDNPLKGKVGVMPVPAGVRGGKSSGTLGGWGIAVSKYSRKHDAALDFMRFFATPEALKIYVMSGAFIPSIVSLFNDPEVAARIPVSDPEVYRNAIPRPAAATGTHYNRVSSEFYNAVHDVLSKKKTADAALKDLEGSLKRISRRGW